jgi:hypothetical protein
LPPPVDLSSYVKSSELGGLVGLYGTSSVSDVVDKSIFSAKIDYSSLPLFEKEMILPGVKRPETIAQVAVWLMETRGILHETQAILSSMRR